MALYELNLGSCETWPKTVDIVDGDVEENQFIVKSQTLLTNLALEPFSFEGQIV